jgi:hypothetical protein
MNSVLVIYHPTIAWLRRVCWPCQSSGSLRIVNNLESFNEDLDWTHVLKSWDLPTSIALDAMTHMMKSILSVYFFVPSILFALTLKLITNRWPVNMNYIWSLFFNWLIIPSWFDDWDLKEQCHWISSSLSISPFFRFSRFETASSG